jgi:hypothetical protein
MDVREIYDPIRERCLLKRSPAGLTALTLVLASGTSCGDGASEPELPARLEFSTPVLELGFARDGLLELLNTGGRALGPVEIQPGLVRDESGATVPGSRVLASPGEIPTLNPGAGSTVELDLSLSGTLAPGAYDAVVVARAGTEAQASVAVRFLVGTEAEEAAATLVIGTLPSDVRQGDVTALPVEVRDAAGTLLEGAAVRWSVSPAGAGFVGGNGQFVGYRPGPISLVARVGNAVDSVRFTVGERGLTGAFTVVGRGEETLRFTSDLWLHGDHAYTGTWGRRPADAGYYAGNTLFAWDVSEPSNPRKAGSIRVDARTVNDVKVRADGTLAVITHEGSNDGLNGITVLDLQSPGHPAVVGRFSDELQPGVHNVWLDGEYAYLVVDGVGSGLRVLYLSDPARPQVVARYYAGSSFLHDVYVRDGLAFLSHWNAGLVILDVGNGIAGGAPGRPVEVSRLADLDGETHNAWYWPEAGYVFVGEEDFSTPGRMHVVDVGNLREPREVATFQVPGQTPHNFWLDEDQAVLYLAWYGNGIRALDVSGTLLGELDRQGREMAGERYNPGPGFCDRSSGDTCTWAPQLHRGLVWVADMNSGLIALEPPR